MILNKNVCLGVMLVIALFSISAFAGAAEPRAVSGTVTGIAGGPVVRAVVYVTGTLDQTVTDDSGRFTLDVPAHRNELLVQALGYQELQVQLDENRANALEVELKPKWKPEWIQAMTSQQADPDFKMNTGGPPTFAPGEGPVITVDEGHHNFHTATGRYRFFADILQQDGYVVERSGTAFTRENLAHVELLVVATPFNGMETGGLPTLPALKEEEVTHLIDWVKQGGSLFLVCDHMPLPGSMQNLLEAFGIHGLNGGAMPRNVGETRDSTIVFRRSDGSLAPHPLLDGLKAAERVSAVASLGGFAFQAGSDFQPLFVLPEDVESFQMTHLFMPSPDVERIPVGGWLQAAVAEIDKGRVALIGEAGMFTAQIRGPDQRANGLSSPHTAENPQFLLNVMHWLSGLID